MIDDLIPFLIFIGVALINLIKTAIERGGAKLAPPKTAGKPIFECRIFRKIKKIFATISFRAYTKNIK